MQKPIAVRVRKLSVYLQPFCRSSFLECALQPKIVKINKNFYFRSSGSFKVIDVNTTEKLVTIVLVVISSMSIPLCNRFHERLANNGKITTFTGVPLFDAFVRRFPRTYKIKIWTAEMYVQCCKFYMQLIYVNLNWFRRNSLLKCVSQPEIDKKSIQPLF